MLKEEQNQAPNRTLKGEQFCETVFKHTMTELQNFDPQQKLFNYCVSNKDRNTKLTLHFPVSSPLVENWSTTFSVLSGCVGTLSTCWRSQMRPRASAILAAHLWLGVDATLLWCLWCLCTDAASAAHTMNTAWPQKIREDGGKRKRGNKEKGG